jgi:hypothetical protein
LEIPIKASLKLCGHENGRQDGQNFLHCEFLSFFELKKQANYIANSVPWQAQPYAIFCCLYVGVCGCSTFEMSKHLLRKID